MTKLDRTNLLLIESLQKDARKTITELARLAHRGESTVRERVLALERSGILRGYRALVDLSALGFRARGILRAQCDPRAVAELGWRLEAIPNVLSACIMTGPKPLRVEIVAEDVRQLEDIVERRIACPQISDWELAVELQGLVEPRPVPLGVVPFAAGENGANVSPKPLFGRPPDDDVPNAAAASRQDESLKASLLPA